MKLAAEREERVLWRFTCSGTRGEIEESKIEYRVESGVVLGIESVHLIMIAMELLFRVQINSEMVMPITLSGVNLKTKVETLKQEAAERWNLPKDSIEFIYCGLILEDDATVESIGLKNGSMVHALQKREPESSISNKHISEDCILQLASAFKSFNETPAFRSALHRLSKRPEVIDNIISSSPGLHEDAVAIAMLQDPDLMAHFIDVDTVRRNYKP